MPTACLAHDGSNLRTTFSYQPAVIPIRSLGFSPSLFLCTIRSQRCGKQDGDQDFILCDAFSPAEPLLRLSAGSPPCREIKRQSSRESFSQNYCAQACVTHQAATFFAVLAREVLREDLRVSTGREARSEGEDSRSFLRLDGEIMEEATFHFSSHAYAMRAPSTDRYSLALLDSSSLPSASFSTFSRPVFLSHTLAQLESCHSFNLVIRSTISSRQTVTHGPVRQATNPSRFVRRVDDDPPSAPSSFAGFPGGPCSDTAVLRLDRMDRTRQLSHATVPCAPLLSPQFELQQ